ncbi:sugar phosphate isomerase/epimerase family protein [Paenibacillus abyssi]|uniref:Isomerase n=1 Tax=Paenibacillus abyssi TaxID=1340531 RepID=A0A917LEZ9_9BACL|nr:sugar phosphate isomerase/epimerase family protein [Paenibacillus abyssi]GGG16742.1 isomerase [Paenibacillus abyssi]
MKVGMNLLLWTDNPTYKEHHGLLTNIKEWGFDGVEFQIAPMAAEDIKALSNHCDELGLGRTAILAMDAAAADPASSDKSLRDAAIEEIKKAVEKTREIGSDLLVGPIFQGLGRFTGQAPTEQEWKWAVETIRSAAEYAQQMGVKIALEPINRFEMYILNTVADGARFCEMVDMPNVGLLVDTHHGNIEESNTAEAWSKHAKHIFHVHISENNRGIPGSGQAISEDVFTTLKEINYDGWLTIEAFNGTVKGLVPRLHLWRKFAERDEDIAILGNQFIRKHLR